MSRLRRVFAAVAALAVLSGACQGGDDPEQDLPCEFYERQLETGAVEESEIPEECRDEVSVGSRGAPGAQGAPGAPGAQAAQGAGVPSSDTRRAPAS